MSIGKRIKGRRLALGLSQAKIATRMSLSQVSLQRWENETNEPSLEKISALSRILSVKPEWLAFGIGDCLLICPFCGKIPEHIINRHDGKITSKILCKTCFVNMHYTNFANQFDENEAFKELYKRWNKRIK